MPRVLIAGFCAVPAPERTGVQLGHVLDALGATQTVDVLALRQQEQAYVERQGNVRLLRVPLHDDAPRSQVEAFRRALRRQLEGADYDIVQFRDGWAGIPVLELRERLGYAAVFDAARSPMAEPQILELDLSAELSRDHEACLLGADLVLAPHEPARRFMAARGRPDRVFLVPVGVDVNEFDWDYYPPEDQPPRILYAGTLEPGRGVRVLLRAMVDVAARSNAVLTLAGPTTPEFAETLRAAVRDLGLSGRIELLGAVEHARMPALIASATVCVAPAAVELTPRPIGLYPTKLLEYMACRRPVVAPRRGTVTMLLEDGAQGLLFTPGDPLDLARALLTLLARPDLRERLADGGYDLVRRQHTASATRRSLRMAYAALAARSPWRERLAAAAAAGETDPELLAPPPRPEPDDDATDFHAPAIEERPAPPAWPDDRAGSYTPGDITRVDTAGRPAADSGEFATMEARPSDEWMVTEPRRKALPDRPATGDAAVRDEDDGTPVDVAPVRPNTNPLENRFVAGEVEVPTPPPEPEPEADADVDATAFTAVSVLLGGADEDATPGPTPAPTDRSPPETGPSEDR